jgi:CubicO group peptidase (beta-lactamase class C family)
VVAGKDTIYYKHDSRSFAAARAKAPAGYISGFFTTLLALQLVDEGKIDLEDKVAQYIPSFAKYGKNYITIRTCLSHQTGILLDMRLFSKFGRTLEDEVNSYAPREIYANPGTEARYSDKGVIIVARIIEIVTKKKFEMLAQQKLFRPLGMRQTTFNTQLLIRSTVPHRILRMVPSLRLTTSLFWDRCCCRTGNTKV